MREFLTGVAIILIVVLTTVLVAPYFVDWNGQREFLEARLSHALGQKVTVGGAIDLKLLPTPYLVLDQVVVGGDEATIKIGIRHLNLELAIAPLLHGEFDIVEARLREPTIRATLESDRRLPTLPAAPAFSADVRFDRIRVEDGTFAVADPESGRTFLIDHLDFDADAASFTGPFKIVGAGGPPDRRTSFRLTTGEVKDGRVRARASIDENSVHAGVDFDGVLDLRATGGSVAQSADGKLALSGRFPRIDKDPIPWRLSGQLQLDTTRAQIESGELRLGSEDAGLTLQADAKAEFGRAAKLEMELKAKQLDIDRLSGAPTSGSRAPPRLPGLAELHSLFQTAKPSIPTTLAVKVETATYAGETLSGIEFRTTVGDGAAHPLTLAIEGPGGTRIAANGTLATGDAPSFSGPVDLVVEDIPRALDWAKIVAPALPWTGRNTPFERMKLAGPVKWDAQELSSPSIDAALDRTTLAGKVRLAFGSDDHSKLVADLVSKSLDVDRLPGLDRLLGGADMVDLDLRLDAEAVKVSRLGDGSLDAGRVRVDLGRAGGTIDVRKLQIEDLGGADVKATGDLGPEGGHLKMTLDARRLDAIAGLVHQLAPGRLSEMLATRASALAPAKLDVETSVRVAANAMVPASFAIAGSLGSTGIDARAKMDADVATSISVTLRSPDGAALLHQLGLQTVPVDPIGASRVSLMARGAPGERLETKMEGSFGTTKAKLSGRFDLQTLSPAGSGDVELKSADLAPLLQTLAVAFPDPTRRISADAKGVLSIEKGDVNVTNLNGRFAGIETKGAVRWRRTPEDQAPLSGTLEIDRLSLSSLVGLAVGHEDAGQGSFAWSRQPFAVGLVDPPRAAFSLKAKVLDVFAGLQTRNAQLDLDVGSNTVSIEKASADIAGGRVSGRAKLRRDGRQATVEGQVALEKGRVDIPSTLDASLDGKLDFAGGGASAFALISSLAGSGEATVHGLHVAGADPKALQHIFDEVEADVLAVDQDAVVRAYDEASRGPISLGTATFGVRLVAGVLQFDPKSRQDTAGPVMGKVDASFDLPKGQFSAHVEETLAALPKGWIGSPPVIVLALNGPLGRPTRAVDVSGFVNAVAARALTREAARIEAYELDVRERAFFNARLRSERRREDERQKAEDDARKAEAERKARLEAARQERLRKDADEKAARDAETQGDRGRTQQPPPRDGAEGAKPGEPPATDAAKDPSSLGRY